MLHILAFILSIFSLASQSAYDVNITQNYDFNLEKSISYTMSQEEYSEANDVLNSYVELNSENRDNFFKRVADLFNGEVKIETEAPIIESYTLTSAKVVTPVKIVLLSDLHSRIFIENQQPLIDMIKEQNPDLIILAGDMIDDIAPIIGAELLFEGIKDLCPIYYVNGNHEYKSNNIEWIREYIKGYGIIILSDEYVNISVKGNELILAGIEDSEKTKREDRSYSNENSMKNAFSSLSYEGEYKILIAHKPENIRYYRAFSFDLVLSGHTHGGQIRLLPHIDGLISANQGLFPKYAGGLFDYGNMIHIISRGLANTLPVPRIGNPTEVVVIELLPE